MGAGWLIVCTVHYHSSQHGCIRHRPPPLPDGSWWTRPAGTHRGMGRGFGRCHLAVSPLAGGNCVLVLRGDLVQRTGCCETEQTRMRGWPKMGLSQGDRQRVQRGPSCLVDPSRTVMSSSSESLWMPSERLALMECGACSCRQHINLWMGIRVPNNVSASRAVQVSSKEIAAHHRGRPAPRLESSGWAQRRQRISEMEKMGPKNVKRLQNRPSAGDKDVYWVVGTGGFSLK